MCCALFIVDVMPILHVSEYSTFILIIITWLNISHILPIVVITCPVHTFFDEFMIIVWDLSSTWVVCNLASMRGINSGGFWSAECIISTYISVSCAYTKYHIKVGKHIHLHYVYAIFSNIWICLYLYNKSKMITHVLSVNQICVRLLVSYGTHLIFLIFLFLH